MVMVAVEKIHCMITCYGTHDSRQRISNKSIQKKYIVEPYVSIGYGLTNVENLTSNLAHSVYICSREKTEVNNANYKIFSITCKRKKERPQNNVMYNTCYGPLFQEWIDGDTVSCSDISC